MDRFLIAPFDNNSGAQTNVRPWLIPDEAFAELENAYVWRGRVRKRFGSRWLGDDPLGCRLRMSLGTTDNTGTIHSVAPIAITPIAIGQMFSVGTDVFTVNTLGTPALMLSSAPPAAGTVDNTTGDVVVTNSVPNTTLYYYPALPVMGFAIKTVTASNYFETIAFDTRFSYVYANGWELINAGTYTFTGTDTNFFWTTMWTGEDPSTAILFATNFNPNDPHYMRALVPVANVDTWETFFPNLDSTGLGVFLWSARILVAFHNCLIALNTWEGPLAGPAVNYGARARYNSPKTNPLDIAAWDIVQWQARLFVDATTTEKIITAGFIKDRLIVYFERSTWELVYTGNDIGPFNWQKINTELGASSTFSMVPFDTVALGIGNAGVISCTGQNVDRIDAKIPQAVFNINTVDTYIQRVFGIRDYYAEMTYWAYPNTNTTALQPWNNKLLVYNYRNNTWAFNDDTVTAFGYCQPATGITWDSASVTWDSSSEWDAGVNQPLFRQVIAGNQEGFTFICDIDQPTNAAVLQITDLINPAGNQLVIGAINHNLRQGDYVSLTGIVDLTGNLSDLNGQIFEVTDATLANNFTIIPDVNYNGTYLGGGLIARVSRIAILTKQFNFYAKDCRNAFISRIDFLVDATAAGAIEVDFFDNSMLDPMVQYAQESGTLMGLTPISSNLETFPYTVYYPYEETATRLWHPVYFNAEGNFVQFYITYNNDQLVNPLISGADFQMHAMLINAMPSASRLE